MGAMVMRMLYQLRREARFSLLEMAAIHSCMVSMTIARDTASTAWAMSKIPMFHAAALRPQLSIQIQSAACISRLVLNRSAKAPKQNIHTTIQIRLTAMFDEAIASLVPSSSAIYDNDGTKMELAEITLIAAKAINVQLIR